MRHRHVTRTTKLGSWVRVCTSCSEDSAEEDGEVRVGKIDGGDINLSAGISAPGAVVFSSLPTNGAEKTLLEYYILTKSRALLNKSG